MVKPFSFSRLPLIWFGQGRFGLLPGLIKKSGRHILLVTGRSSFAGSEHAKQLFADLAGGRIEVSQVKVAGEPQPAVVVDAVREFREEKIELVVAVGGGSVIDAGKAISAMLPIGEGVREYLEGVGKKDHPGIKVPFIAVPTTAGTGSEATKNAVLSETGPEGFKRSLRHDNFVPDIALVDPVLTLGCPPGITAAAGMDCFTQLVEAYLSDQASDYTDALALEGLKAIKYSLEETFRNGNNIDARTGMSFAALTSGICLANAGLGVIHGFASSIGSRVDIAHGVVCGTLMASANNINIKEIRRRGERSVALNKYVKLGELFSERKGKTDDFYIDSFVDYLFRLTEELNLPRLGNYGINDEDVEAICIATENKNNPVKLSRENIAEILSSRL